MIALGKDFIMVKARLTGSFIRQELATVCSVLFCSLVFINRHYKSSLLERLENVHLSLARFTLKKVL